MPTNVLRQENAFLVISILFWINSIDITCPKQVWIPKKMLFLIENKFGCLRKGFSWLKTSLDVKEKAFLD